MITSLAIDLDTVRGSYVGDPTNLQKPAPSIRSNLRFGIEAETLKGFSIRQVQIGVAEHNYLEFKRNEIKALMESHGYKRVHTSDRDDFYVLANP